MDRIDGITAEVQSLLKSQWLGRHMEGHQEVTSTNTLAAARAGAGAPEGSVIWTEFQTQGRGRLGRIWNAQSGLNLMFSTILYPPLPADWLGLITLATGVAVVETILTCAPPLQPSIKWPNDVLINERKCCGILLESSFAHGSTMRRIVILGIGLNVNQIDFPPSLAETATSMRLEAGHVIPRTHVFATLLDQLEMHYESLLQDSGESIRRAYRSYLKGIGLPVSIRLLAQKQEVYGILRGIDEQGALLLDVNGLVQPYYAGDVTFILR